MGLRTHDNIISQVLTSLFNPIIALCACDLPASNTSPILTSSPMTTQSSAASTTFRPSTESIDMFPVCHGDVPTCSSVSSASLQSEDSFLLVLLDNLLNILPKDCSGVEGRTGVLAPDSGPPLGVFIPASDAASSTSLQSDTKHFPSPLLTDPVLLPLLGVDAMMSLPLFTDPALLPLGVILPPSLLSSFSWSTDLLSFSLSSEFTLVSASSFLRPMLAMIPGTVIISLRADPMLPYSSFFPTPLNILMKGFWEGVEGRGVSGSDWSPACSAGRGLSLPKPSGAGVWYKDNTP